MTMTRADALNYVIGKLMQTTTRDPEFEVKNEALDVFLRMYAEELLAQQVAEMSRVKPEVDGEGVPYDKDLLRPSFLEVEIQQPDPVVISNGEVRPDLGLIDLLKQVLAVEDAEGHVVHPNTN